MRYVNILDKDGNLKKKVQRNCDRVCNIQDARGKFVKETGAKSAHFYENLCAWLLAPTEG